MIINCQEAKIILLQKPGKDLKYLQTYRPISLLNCDYKILARVLAIRLNRVLSMYIHPDPVGFIKNRQLRYCTRRLCNIIDYLQTFKIPAIMYYTDAEKVFDCVYWGFLRRWCLEWDSEVILCSGLSLFTHLSQQKCG